MLRNCHTAVFGLLRLAMLVAVLNAASTAAFAQESSTGGKPEPLKLELQPTELTLDMETVSRGRLLVLAHNAGAMAVSRAELAFIAPVGLNPIVVTSPRLPSSGDLSWVVEVTGNETLPSPAKLVVQLSYSSSDAVQSTAIVAGTAAITLQTPLSVAGAIKATLLPSEAALDELKPLDLRLHIDNPTRRTVEIDKIELGPSLTYLELTVGKHDTSVAPGGTLAVPLTLTTKPSVPGTYALVVGFNARFRDSPLGWEPTAAQGKITIGLPGVADALQFLGIPSFLLLPGALMILTFVTLLPWITRLPEIDWKKPGLLLLAVILSFAAAYIYPELKTYHLGTGHDYLRGYDMWDVVYVWSGSMAVGAAAVTLVAIAFWSTVAARFYLARYLEPDQNDSAIKILRKLHRRGKPFRLPARRFAHPQAGAPEHSKLILPFGQVGAGQQWLVQRARVHATQAPGATGRIDSIQELLEQIDHLTPGAIGRLVREIDRGLSREEVTLAWEHDPNEGPRCVNQNDYVDAQQLPQMFVFKE